MNFNDSWHSQLNHFQQLHSSLREVQRRYPRCLLKNDLRFDPTGTFRKMSLVDVVHHTEDFYEGQQLHSKRQ